MGGDDIRAVVERVRSEIGYFDPRDRPDLEALCTAALRAETVCVEIIKERDAAQAELAQLRAERDRLQELDLCVRSAHFLSLNANDVWSWASADACQFSIDTGLDLLLEMRRRWGNEGELAFMAEGEGREPQAPLLAKLGPDYREAREFVRGKDTGIFRSMEHPEQQLAAEKKVSAQLRTRLAAVREELAEAKRQVEHWREARRASQEAGEMLKAQRDAVLADLAEAKELEQAVQQHCDEFRQERDQLRAERDRLQAERDELKRHMQEWCAENGRRKTLADEVIAHAPATAANYRALRERLAEAAAEQAAVKAALSDALHDLNDIDNDAQLERGVDKDDVRKALTKFMAIHAAIKAG